MKNSELTELRHSCAHLLASAVKNLYPNTKLGIGPVIENGFYYEFSFKKPISSDDLSAIESEMKKLSQNNDKFEKKIYPIAEALEITEKSGESFKSELIKDLAKKGKETVSFYQTGKFTDLCTGPHVNKSGEVKYFRLLSLSAAYWKADQNRQSLTRIYGTAWNSQKELDDYLSALEKARENDHRKIGKELGLFTFSDLIGQGLPLLTPKGASLRRTLERFIVDLEIKNGYQHVWTPPLAKIDLYKLSGHYPYFKDSMYPSMKVDDEELILRPMTCPHHFMIFKSEPRSYRDLPLRMAEIAPMFRYEKSGELSGLMRVRMFTLADAHIFTSIDDAKTEIEKALKLIEFSNKALGLEKGKDYSFRLSLGDRKDTKKYYKDDKAWEKAEGTLREVLQAKNENFDEVVGEAAFYGPKIDIQMKNALGKEETAFTVQYDFVMPKRFELSFIDQTGSSTEPVVIHRSSIGAIERVMAFLLEHYGGRLPFWLSPIQAMIIPIADRHVEYAEKLRKELMQHSFRIELNEKSEPMQAKIRDAQIQKIPYMLIVGDKEQVNGTVSVRTLESQDSKVLKIGDFIALAKEQNPEIDETIS